MSAFHCVFIVAAISLLLQNGVAADPVHIISFNLEQTVTSSTLQWMATDGKDPGALKYAVVAAYQTIDATNEPIPPEGGEGNDNDIVKDHKEPVYICRAKVTSIWVTGQLRPKNHVCVVSLYKKVEEYKQFEILINIDHGARLSWVGKNKYTNLPQGAVTSGENVLRSFVSRKPTDSEKKASSLTHYVGTFYPAENLGVYHLVDENNSEISFEEGEILVETEPVAYEFKQLKFRRTGRRFPKRKLTLAQTILKNDENGLQKVDSVMTYNYSYFLGWGKGHGMQTGLPFTVFLPNGSKVESMWALPKSEDKVETVPVEKYLEEGTAVNITLVGNYTEMEVPYTATVVAIYKDGERLEFTIDDIKRENKVIDVAFDFSPVYFLHNNSHVPTTTTTTTSTTTTTTTTAKSTSTTQEITPIVPPEVIVRRKQEELHAASKKSDGSNDEDNAFRIASSLEKKPESPASSATSLTSLVSFTYVLLMVLLRLT